LDVAGAHFSWALDYSGAQFGLGLNLGLEWVSLVIGYRPSGLGFDLVKGPILYFLFSFLSFFSFFLFFLAAQPVVYFAWVEKSTRGFASGTLSFSSVSVSFLSCAAPLLLSSVSFLLFLLHYFDRSSYPLTLSLRFLYHRGRETSGREGDGDGRGALGTERWQRRW
jgi:hypothetical protein